MTPQQRFEEELARAGRSGVAAEVPAWAIGPFRFFNVDGRPAGFVLEDGTTAWVDGRGAWDRLLLAAPPETVANGLAGALGGGMITPVGPGSPELRGRPEGEIAQVHGPSVVRATDGTVRFLAFYAVPPGPAVVRLEVRTALGGAPATFERVPLEPLVAPADQVTTWAAKLPTEKGTAKLDLIRSLAASGSAAAVDPLVGVLGDRWVDARKAAASGLEQLGDPRALGPLDDAVAKETDPGAALAMVAAMAKVGGAEAKPLLTALAGAHPNELVRNRARYEADRL